MSDTQNAVGWYIVYWEDSEQFTVCYVDTALMVNTYRAEPTLKAALAVARAMWATTNEHENWHLPSIDIEYVNGCHDSEKPWPLPPPPRWLFTERYRLQTVLNRWR